MRRELAERVVEALGEYWSPIDYDHEALITSVMTVEDFTLRTPEHVVLLARVIDIIRRSNVHDEEERKEVVARQVETTLKRMQKNGWPG